MIFPSAWPDVDFIIWPTKIPALSYHLNRTFPFVGMFIDELIYKLF